VDAAERRLDVKARAVDQVLADVFLVRRAAHLQHGQPAPHLAVKLDVAQEDDRVGDRRDVRLRDRLAPGREHRGRVREQAGDLEMLDRARQRDHELAERLRRGHSLERGHAVDRDPLRREREDVSLQLDEVILEAHHLGVATDDAEEASLLRRLEVDPPRAGVARELLAALLGPEEQTSFAGLDRGLHVLRDHQRLARAGRPAHQDDRVPVHAAAAHPIELGNARGDPDHGGLLLELDRGQRDDRHPVVGIDRERVLAFVVGGTAKLQDLDRAPALLVLEPIPHEDDVVGDELLDAPAPDIPLFAGPLHRDQRGDAQGAEPGRDAVSR
jgi:hypothetical protein